VPFLQRTPSGQIHLENCSNVTISGYQFVSMSDDAIIIENCSNVTVTANDFSDDVGGVFVLNSTNVTVTWNRFRNIGDGSIGSGHSNYVQFNNVTGGYIGHNKGIGGDTEDMISIFESGGASASNPLVIEYNAFESPLTDKPNERAWTSDSGTGTNLGDGGGSHVVLRYNTYLNVAQVGIAIGGGTDMHMIGNVVYGANRPLSNVGMSAWNQGGPSTSGVGIASNRVWWLADGGDANPYWNGGNVGTVAGESSNVLQDTSIDPATLAVTL
jgi:parallel beta-helix repeat protein